MKGDKSLYLKVTFSKFSSLLKPITDINFYKILKNPQIPDKLQISIRQQIEPIPIKLYGKPPPSNVKKTKIQKKLKEGKVEDFYNFYGNYDLTEILEE